MDSRLQDNEAPNRNNIIDGGWSGQDYNVNAQQTNSSTNINIHQNINDENGDANNNDSDPQGLFTRLIKKYPWLLPIPYLIIIFLGGALWFSIQKNIEQFTSRYDEKFEDLEASNERLTAELYALSNQLSNINGALNNIQILYSNSVTPSVEPNGVIPTGMSYASTPKINVDEIVGIDTSGKEYHPEDLVNKTVLLAYKENDYEVFFYGQINENYHWNGYCVTNAYTEDGSLYGICESNYDDGKRLDYISLYAGGESSNSFIYANRILSNDKNYGTTINYYFPNIPMKIFEYNSVRVTDILYVNNVIRDARDLRIEKYYNGATVNNLFDDNTGTACSIKFFEDGSVESVYQGCFSNGNRQDNTGNAFVIKYDIEKNNII